jgi:hypothetical protein
MMLSLALVHKLVYRWKIDKITEAGLQFTQLEALPAGSEEKN